MKKISYILLGFSFVILIFSFIFFFYFNRPLKSWSIYTSFEVTDDTGGFDLNKTALTFGKIPRGSSSSRNVDFDNGYDFQVRLSVVPYGDIKNYVHYDNNAIVYPNETSKISFVIEVPSDLPLGTYDGNIKFDVYRFYK